MLTKDIIIAVGDSGTILRSFDAGENWNYQPFPGLSSNLNGVFFPTPDFGAIVGDSFPPFGGPPIITSSDSGVSFSPFGQDPNLADFSFNSVFIPKKNPAKAVLVGNRGTIVSTTNAGANWKIPISPVTVAIKDVWFFTDDDGFATGPGGVLLRTNDCGDTWTQIVSPSNRDINTVVFPDSTRGYFGGGFGGMFRTDDGGLTFTNLQSGFFPQLNDVAFLDDSFGIAVGNFGSILRTSNGGDAWNPINAGTIHPFEAIGTTENSPSTQFWAAGGTFGDSARIFFSSDSGLNWFPQPIPSPFKLFGITFSDSLNGTAVGLNGSIYCTKNGGKNWIKKNSNVNEWLLDVSMPNDSCAFVVGGVGRILRTKDSGNSWTPQNSGTLEWLTSVSFLDDSIGIAAGNKGVILRTQDAGQSWENISPRNISIDFTDIFIQRGRNKNTGFSNVFVTAVGFGGTILYSSDGGSNWTEQYSPFNGQIWGMHMRDSVNGWVVGEIGTILRSDGEKMSVGIEELVGTPASHSFLGINYPNPISNGHTRIPFNIPGKAFVSLRIYDMRGKELFRLIDQEMQAGEYEYDWEVPKLSPGIYLYQLRVDGRAISRKMIIER
ncbi:MAG: YCF48-related protein [Bacteroidota bacterium]